MIDQSYIRWTFVILSIVCFFLTTYFPQLDTYGRHSNANRCTMRTRVGWIVFESPSSIGFVVFYLLGDRTTERLPAFLCLLWMLHYIHRGLIYPLTMKIREHDNGVPIHVVAFAFVTNVGISFLNASSLSWSMYRRGNDDEFQVDRVQFLVGVALFAIGYYANRKSDAILVGLRKPGETASYKIPHGFLFDYVTCANYFGEIVQWFGFALAAQTPAAWTFVLWTLSNLIPRANRNHAWYVSKFKDYPKERRVLIPYVW
jgi:steroid 5-alpha reductase family enzyme